MEGEHLHLCCQGFSFTMDAGEGSCAVTDKEGALEGNSRNTRH